MSFRAAIAYIRSNLETTRSRRALRLRYSRPSRTSSPSRNGRIQPVASRRVMCFFLANRFEPFFFPFSQPGLKNEAKRGCRCPHRIQKLFAAFCLDKGRCLCRVDSLCLRKPKCPKQCISFLSVAPGLSSPGCVSKDFLRADSLAAQTSGVQKNRSAEHTARGITQCRP